ncbi:hypothetical protein [Mucilaginibacter jinjuensis]|uniref:Uncharacterized protein n=1 Tax=Mucilaginibacter jinjuensis TaxID=1176721 RepID=A0ABY7TA64_9SPHI|nr:hypothetical protein [Mucilaginibacter jinjuensis]WCT13306.1 hypothetical protein PQO05_05090 [Mucilaginibacter jinjuensis]
MKTEDKLRQIQLFDLKILIDLKADLKKLRARKHGKNLIAA